MNKIRVVQILAALHGVIEVSFDTIFNAVLFLMFGFSSVEAAGSTVGVAAKHRHFFKNDDFLTEVVSRHSCRQTGAAGTDYDDIGLVSRKSRDSKGGRNYGSQK